MPLWKFCYILLDSEIGVHGTVRQARLMLSVMDLKQEQQEYSLEKMLLKLQYGRGNRVVDKVEVTKLTDEDKRDILMGTASHWVGRGKPKGRDKTYQVAGEEGQEKDQSRKKKKKSKIKGPPPFRYKDWDSFNENWDKELDEAMEEDGWPSTPPYKE